MLVGGADVASQHPEALGDSAGFPTLFPLPLESTHRSASKRVKKIVC